MNKLGLRTALYDGDGYSIGLKLTQVELATVYKIIRVQWLYRLQLLVPKYVCQFNQLGMQRYHELAHVIDHAESWPRYSRILPQDAVDIIKQMPFFKQLESEFDVMGLADEEDFGWDNIYWRLVRPGTSDYGSIHADKWFWDIGEYKGKLPNEPYERIKVWIAIDTVSGKNGLMVAPKSHLKKDWKWHTETHYHRKKPIFDEDINNMNLTLLPTESGRSVVFHDELLHGGAANLAETTRVSIEFTLLIKPVNH